MTWKFSIKLFCDFLNFMIMILLISIHLRFGYRFLEDVIYFTENEMKEFNNIGWAVFVLILIHSILFIMLEMIKYIDLIATLCKKCC
jgi:hypothetical protein